MTSWLFDRRPWRTPRARSDACKCGGTCPALCRAAVTLIDQPGDELDRAQFAHERRIECDFVQMDHDLLVRGRRRVALQRIDLHQQYVFSRRGPEQGENRWVAEIAASYASELRLIGPPWLE